jgi:hypothetical protein
MYGGVVRIAPYEVAVADIAGVSQIHKIGSGFLKSAFYQKLTPHRKPGIFAMRDPSPCCSAETLRTSIQQLQHENLLGS